MATALNWEHFPLDLLRFHFGAIAIAARFEGGEKRRRCHGNQIRPAAPLLLPSIPISGIQKIGISSF